MNSLFLELVAFAFVATMGIAETTLHILCLYDIKQHCIFRAILNSDVRVHCVFSTYYDTKDASFVI